MRRKKHFTIAVVTVVLFVILLWFLHYSSSNRPRILLIGLDGAEWAIINQLTAEGKLPNLKKLIDEGTSGNLRSITPILSPIVWTSIATGKTPEKHGIAWFMVRDAKTKAGIPVTSTMRNTRALWNILSDHDKKVGMIGWWASWPAEKVNGFIISDHIAYHGFGLTSANVKTEAGLTYPQEIAEEVKLLQHNPQKLSKSEIDRFMNITEDEYNVSIHAEFSFGNPLHHFMYALANSKTYLDMYRKLKQKYDVDLMGVYFEGIDTVGHLYMKYRPPKMDGMPEEYFRRYSRVMDEYYMYQDEILGEILQDVNSNTTVIVCSDHGFKTGDDRLKEFYSTNVRNAARWHEINGVVIMKGPNIKRNTKIEGSSVLDITPTILYLLGLPVARDMDGKVLTDAILPEYLEKREMKYVTTYETHEEETRDEHVQVAQTEIDESIKARLESLGYLGGGSSTSSVLADEIYLNRASALLEKRQYRRAITEVEKILDRDPDNAKALLFLAQTYHAQGKYDDSLKEAHKLIEARERGENIPRELLGKAHASMAISHLGLNRKDEALKSFRSALDVSPQDPQIHYNLATLYQRDNEYEKAISEYETSIALAPENSYAYNNLGNIYKILDQREKAAILFEKAVNANPNNAEAHFNLGICHMEDEAYDRAALAFEKALFLRNFFPQAKINMGFANLKMSKFEEAKNIFEDFLSQFRNSPLGWYGLAVAQEETGDNEGAHISLNRALALDRAMIVEKIEEDGVFKDAGMNSAEVN